MRSNFVLGMALVTLASCKDDDKTNILGNTASAKLEASDIQPPSDLPQLTGTEAVQTLNESAFLENDRGHEKRTALIEAPTSDTERHDLATLCLDQMINEIVIHASQDTLVVDQTFDFRNCVQEKAAAKTNMTVDITEASASYFILSSCEGADFSSFNGKKLSEAGDIPETCSGKISYQLASRSRAQISVVMDGSTQIFNTETTESQSLEDGSPCEGVLKDGLRTETACISIRKHVDLQNPSLTRYTKFVSTDLTWADADVGAYYNSGSLSLLVNDWTGSLVYGGRQSAPTYTLSRGSESASGTIAVQSLNLKEKMRIELSKQLNLIRMPTH